ncbi:MAG: methionyl-tRNA formyltransferase [Opitutales bacterium]|nr:methionyl-tRNA formyltransferase [Opitutales bacterium]
METKYERKNVVFFASDAIALPILETLMSAPLRAWVKIVGIYSQPDRARGRGQKVSSNPIAQWAKDFNIPLFQPEKLGDEDIARLRELRCDIGLVMAYGHILKKSLLEVPTYGFYNYHASLLPHYRGPAPIEAAIAANAGGAGVTLQKIVPALDQGDIIESAVIPLTQESTRAGLREKISEACTFITQQAIPAIIKGEVEPVPQSEKYVSYSRKISRADSALDFNVEAKILAARVRALCGWPGCTIPFNGMELKLGMVEPVYNIEIREDLKAQMKPGTVYSHDGELYIATSNGFLKILALQRPGGRMLPINIFLTGMKITTGMQIESRPMIPLSRPQPWPLVKKQIS